MIVLVRQKQAKNIVLSAQLIGVLNGVNKTFNTPTNYKSGTVNLFCNGQALYSPEDFSETGVNEITFENFAPLSDYILRVTYEEA
jgi:hypothetical protein